jgi:hypothetical protein
VVRNMYKNLLEKFKGKKSLGFPGIDYRAG